MSGTNKVQTQIQAEVEAISNIKAVNSILEVICRTTGMGFAAVARVTENEWIACAVHDEIQFGLLPGGELKLETTICHEIRQSGEAVVIDNVDEDPKFCWHHTPAMYGFKSYISVPIKLKDGTFFGTLCSIDPNPARLNTPHIVGMFTLFADLIAFHLHAVQELRLSNSSLNDERESARLREQFIAILGHDLRNPVSAISGAAEILQRMPLNETVMQFADIIRDSALRMTGLINNMLDFARGRLGDGIKLSRKSNESLEIILDQVITELQVVWPLRIIEKSYQLNEPVNCDGTRIAQLFSNLLSNALTHGKKGSAVQVSAVSVDGEFTLSVSNTGKKISEEVMERLFQPFSRGEVEPRQQGLGLGLFIASEIAKAHGGTLKVASADDETCFTLNIPASV